MPGDQKRPHVVILGAGFAGLNCAKQLANTAVNITVIDKKNYHLFQPLLYQVATAALSPQDIASPIRAIVRDNENTTVLLANVIDIDTRHQQVICSNKHTINYDYLVIATGAKHSYFGKDSWSNFAPGLKNIDDATAIRKNILLAFEQAEITSDPEQCAALMTFVIVGGGPTGVEIAGAIAELARFSLASDFRHITPDNARIILIQSNKRILPGLHEKLSNKAANALKRLGVTVMTGNRVVAMDDSSVTVGEQRIACKTIIWAAGVTASAAGQWIKADTDNSGRIIVNSDLSVPQQNNIYAIGDTALFQLADGGTLPGVAPVAKQQGKFVAKHIKALVKHRKPPALFKYKDYGNLATIGRQAAVAEIANMKLSGFFAWIIWSVTHIYFLVGFKRRFRVTINWLWQYLTFRRGARLITGNHFDNQEK